MAELINTVKNILEKNPSVCRVPNSRCRVYKEECVYSFQTVDSEEGILVVLNSWLCFSPDYAQQNFTVTKNPLYLRIKRTKQTEPKEDKEKELPKVLGVGMEGGFNDGSETKYVFDYSLVILPNFDVIPLPNADLPDVIQKSIKAIIEIDSAEKKEEVKQFTASDVKIESPVALSLIQLGNKKILPLGNWTCDECGGDATTNLWLNLTDGHIGCGRRNFDGTGGKGHAMEHYKQTGYPIVVKLGTITAHLEEADVHDYITDDEIIDPFLEKHLKHFGIDHKKLTKTDKTVAELAIEFQFTYDWSKAEENDKVLVNLYGPGLTGLVNLGNSCYMNSVMQVFFKIPEIADRYYGNYKEIFQNEKGDPADNFHVQMAKLGYGLLSGKYSEVSEEEKKENKILCAVRPLMFKSLIGKGHTEFSTGRQQDALEFIQHILSIMERKEKSQMLQNDPSKVFSFKTQEKMQCQVSGAVSYKEASEKTLFLPIPLDRCTNQAQVLAYQIAESMKSEEEKKKEKEEQRKNGTVVEPVRPIVPLQTCFESVFAQEAIDDWYSPAIKGKSICLKEKRFITFPKYLILQLGRFAFQDRAAKKLDAFIDVPENLDLEYLRAGPRSENEKLMEDEEEKPDEGVISALTGMGFGRNRAVRAWFNTKEQGAEAAMEWIFGHMDDADIDTPFAIPSKKQSQSNDSQYESTAEMMMGMEFGFSKAWTIEALKNTNGDPDRATEWLFSHEEPKQFNQKPENKVVEEEKDAPGRYALFAFITHMGTTPLSGHYVAHIKHGDKWVIFNDSKVAESQDPPHKMAYIYFYRRV